MIIDILKDVILQNIGTLKPASKNWQKRSCMLCHTQGHGVDKRSRFGIQFNASSIAINCFNCKFKTGYTEGQSLSKSFIFFLKEIGIDPVFIKTLEFEIFKLQNNIDSDTTLEEKIQINNYYQRWAPKDLPKNSHPITTWLKSDCQDPNFLNVVNYAIKRGFLYDLDNFYWSPDKQAQINQRLIIPYYYRNKIVGYTARLFYNSNDKFIAKYYQMVPTDFVYNLDNQDDWYKKFVIVTEGVLDAYVVDGVSTLGEINQNKIDIIKRLQKTIIVSPDRDKNGSSLVKAAIENKWAVSFPKWEKGIKDAAQAAKKYGRLLTVQSIIQSAVYEELEIALKWEIESNERN